VPHSQLARQAVTDARTAGIGVVDLTGSNWHWDANDHMAYMRADAIAVAHYGAVFNAYRRLDDAGLLIFDDAHAAAGSIADNWTVRFSYGTPGYIQLVQLLTQGCRGLPPHDSSPGITTRRLVPTATSSNRPS
jgi:hypothetical protein